MSSHKTADSQAEANIEFAPLGYHGNESSPTQGRTVDIVKFILDNWKMLAAGGLAGMLLGVMAYLYAGPRYVASTRLLVSKPPGTPLQEGGVSTFGDTGGHVHVIKSHVIVGRAYEDHELGKLPSILGSDEPIVDIIDGMEVKRSAGQNRDFQSIIDINYTSPSEGDAMVITRAIIDAYDKYLAEVRQDNTQEVLDVFSDADVKLQQEIARLEEEYQQFRQEAPILFATPVGKQTTNGTVITPPNHYLQEVDRIRTNLSAVRTRRTDTLAQMEVLEQMLANGDSRQQVEHLIMLALSRPSASAGKEGGGGGGSGAGALFTGPPAKERLDTELLKQRVDAARLGHHIGDEHPAAVKTQKAINVILDAYRAQGLIPPNFSEDAAENGGTGTGSGVDIATVYMNFLKTQLKQLDYAEVAMGKELTAAIKEAKAASTYEVQDRQLADQLERKKDLYSEMVQRLEKLDLTKEQTGFRMQPMSDVLVEKSFKRVIKIVGAFAILGAMAVFCWLYFQEWRDLSMKTLDEVRRYTDSTVMGSVPHFAEAAKLRAQDGSGLSPALCYYHRPGSREAEAYRSVRTTLFFSTQQKDDRVIQISSPEPADGKSTSIANLAIAVAQSGKRVLLIDCDLRRPTQHILFGVPQHVGVSDVLRREVEWINTVRQTAIDGLNIMTAGDTPENPAELLSSGGLSTILKAARQEFDYVFVDTPPILAVSDPCIIAPHTDGMLLVVRMNKNKRPAVMRTRDILDSHGVNLYGVIANDSESDAEPGANYHDYSSYYTADGSQSPTRQQRTIEVPATTV